MISTGLVTNFSQSHLLFSISNLEGGLGETYEAEENTLSFPAVNHRDGGRGHGRQGEVGRRLSSGARTLTA